MNVHAIKARFLAGFFGVSIAIFTIFGLFGCNNNATSFTFNINGPKTHPTAAMFVPKNAPLMASILVNPSRLENLATGGNQKQWQETLHNWEQSVLNNFGVEYNQELQAWIGNEITLAITNTDLDRDRSNGEQPGELMAIAIKDPVKSQEFWELFWQQQSIAGVNVNIEKYAGVNIFSAQNAVQKLPATALVSNKFVLLANDPQVLRYALNCVQVADLNLDHLPAYQTGLKQLQQGRIAIVFTNLPQLSNWLGIKTAISQTETNPNLPLKSPQTALLASLGFNEQGVLVETALQIGNSRSKEGPIVSTLKQPIEALKLVPSNSILVAGSTELQQLSQNILTEVSEIKGLAAVVQKTLVNLQNNWGIDITKDVLDSLAGEYALAFLPRNDQPQPDLIFIAQKSDKTAEAIANLDKIAQTKGYSISNFTLADRPITAWTKLTTVPVKKSSHQGKNTLIKTEAKGVHTTVGEYEILGTSIDAIANVLGTTTSILDNQQFQDSINSLAKPNDGYLYIDWLESRSLLTKHLPVLRLMELVAEPVFAKLKAVVISSTGSEAGVRHANVLLKLS